MTAPSAGRRRGFWASGGIILLLLTAIGCYVKGCVVGPLPVEWGKALDVPSPGTSWPWPDAREETLAPGVAHWLRAPAPDGTIAELFRFDFAANPRLRFGIYDQDEDDAQPFDNAVTFWARGVGQATRHLNESGRGTVLAAWNGLFFASSDGPTRGRASSIGHHVGPVVLAGKAHRFGPPHRWTFGERHGADDRPAFRVLHQPNAASLAREFTDAADAAQCLVREGKPLTLRPLPPPGDPPAKQPVPSTPAEAGHIPFVDHIKTTRASMAWSRDSRHLYLLFIKEPDSESASILALQRRIPLVGGWTVADLQRFWLSLGVWGAINSDGGDLAQLTYRVPNGRYVLLPPRWVALPVRDTYAPDFRGSPSGGSLMYFYVRSVSEQPGNTIK
jgi:hypothetical protein